MIIGFGKMGQRYYSILRKLNFNIISIIENNEDKILKAIKKFKIKKNIIFKKINKRHLSLKYDLVIISTTTDKKFYFFNQIASNKVNQIFFEKPLVKSLNECKKIEAISKKYKIRIAVNHQLRHTKQISIIKNIVKKIKNQKLIGINVNAGNIGIAMNGVHAIEIFNHLADNNIIKINAILENKKIFNPRGKKFVDVSGNVLCRNKSNQTLSITTSSNQKHGYSMIFNFTSGYIFLNLLNGHLYGNFRKRKYEKFQSGYYGLPSINFTKKIKLSDIETSTKINLTNFLNNTKDYTNLQNAIAAVKALIGIYKSNDSNGMEINLKNLKSNQNFKWA